MHYVAFVTYNITSRLVNHGMMASGTTFSKIMTCIYFLELATCWFLQYITEMSDIAFFYQLIWLNLNLQSEPSFHLFGFIMCIGATAARALKTVLQGILLSSEGEKLNSMNLLLYMAPVAVILLLPATLFMEDNVVGVTIELARKDFTIVWLLLFNSCLAYFVNLTNFLVTKHTSALTLQVLGNAKGAVAVVVSILIFKNPVSITGMLGYTLTVIGVILYSESKKRSKP